ncbi:Na/Pi cotransporter family protein [Anaerostipes sp.]|uniref:Na/Pi cotransporter family protein n=1 Tax=Anaerostipes sp. TaxID=1872530 RepID=UPI0039672DE7
MNTLTHVGNLFAFIGGLGMFLYGMDIMASGLQKTAGNKMRDLLGYLTNNRILGVLVGALVTAIIQSSSATTVMVVGFVNAGIMNLTQAAGVIMGANVGTTITAWLVSANEWAGALKPDFFAPFILGIGAFIITFSNKQKLTQKAEIAVGFGILFIGLSSMSSSISVYQDSPIFYKAFQVLGSNPILGILVGAVVTAIIQSSSASVGILQTLAMRGIVNWRSAIFITLGQNIGTCITAILSSAGANKTAKRAAVIHLSFNVLGAAIYGVIMTIFFGIFPDLAMQHISSTQISIFHSIFNVSVTILLFPFANALVKLSGIIIHEDVVEDEEEEEPEEKALRHLDPRILETPAFAVENAVKEVVRMGEIVLKNLNRVTKEAMRGEEPRQIKIDKVHNDEQVINHLEPMITEYLVKISHLAITEKEMKVVNNLFDSITDIERSGDHVENMAGYLQHIKDMKESISEDAAYELRNMNNLVKSAFESAIRAIEFDDTKEAKETLSYAADVYYTRKTIRKRHIQRMKDGECSPDVGVYFLDIISSMERIAGYAFTIARYILSQNDEEE